MKTLAVTIQINNNNNNNILTSKCVFTVECVLAFTNPPTVWLLSSLPTVLRACCSLWPGLHYGFSWILKSEQWETTRMHSLSEHFTEIAVKQSVCGGDFVTLLHQSEVFKDKTYSIAALVIQNVCKIWVTLKKVSNACVTHLKIFTVM